MWSTHSSSHGQMSLILDDDDLLSGCCCDVDDCSDPPDSGRTVTPPDADSFRRWPLPPPPPLLPAKLMTGDTCFDGFNTITVTSLGDLAVGFLGVSRSCDSHGQTTSSAFEWGGCGAGTDVLMRVPPLETVVEVGGSAALADSHGHTSKSVDGWLSTLQEKLLFLADGLLTIGACPSVWSTDGPGVNREPFVRPLPALSEGGGELIVSQGQTLSSLSWHGRMMDVDSLALLDLMTFRFKMGQQTNKKWNHKNSVEKNFCFFFPEADFCFDIRKK